MANKVLGDRIRERLRLLSEEQEALAKASGYGQQNISAIINGKVDRPRKLREIARFLRTTQEYLLGETNSPDASSQTQAGGAGTLRVPVISWVSAGKLADAQVPIPDGDDRMILVDDLGRGDFFALEVDGDSMDRVSPEGSIIIVNRRERTPVAGKPFVFAVKGQTTYKLWHPKPVYLAPYSTNSMNQPVFVERKRDLEIVGRVKRTMLDL